MKKILSLFCALTATFAASAQTTGKAAVSKSAGISGNEVAWVQLWADGPKWAVFDVGATCIGECGGYYNWGTTVNKSTDYSYCLLLTDIQGTDYDTAKSLWGANWQMPKKSDLNSLLTSPVNWAWKSASESGYGIAGALITGKGDYASNSIFLPASGMFCEDEDEEGVFDVYEKGESYYCWSSTSVTKPGSARASYIDYYEGSGGIGNTSKAVGYSVRAILAATTPTTYTFDESTVTKADLTAAKTAAAAANVTINRTFYKDGGNNTICLPFSLDATALAASPLKGYSKLQEFSSATVVNKGAQDETLELTMTDATGIEAGKPYIIAWANGDNLVNPTFENVTVTADEGSKSTASNGVQFCGALVPFAMTAGDKSYMFVGQSAQLNWPNVDGNLKAFRCYFTVDQSAGAKIFRGMNAYLVDGTETGISSVNSDQLTVNKVQKLLEQGKVVIISNGKRYSLDGKPME